MKRPSIFQGIVFAFVAGAFTFLALQGLPWVFSESASWKLWLAVLLLLQLFHLLLARRARLGVLTLLTVNAMAVFVLLMFPFSVSLLAVALGVAVSLNRSLLYHRSAVACVLDLALSLAGVMFGGFLLSRNGSPAVAVWGYFLLQSTFVLLPQNLKELSNWTAQEACEPFVRGHRVAEAAMEQIIERA